MNHIFKYLIWDPIKNVKFLRTWSLRMYLLENSKNKNPNKCIIKGRRCGVIMLGVNHTVNCYRVRTL